MSVVGPNPSGLCMCGCGKPAPIADRTARGRVKGEPSRYISGHSTRVRARVPLFIRLLNGRRIVGDCWEWTGKPQHGYGVMRYQGRSEYVHRLAYELFVGPYPDWAQHTDHLCRNTMCFNPEHLEPVTARENCLRGVAPGVLVHLTGVCQRGHAMTPDNVYVRPDTGRSMCRECIRMRRKRYARGRRARRRIRDVARRRAHENERAQHEEMSR